jgi:hypothetical protein
MNIAQMPMQSSLRLSGVLLILGLAVGLASLLWETPLSFLFFASVGGVFLLGGVAVYLYSLISPSQ